MSGQREDPLVDQMADVVKVAREMGCHDAADWMTRVYGGMEDPLGVSQEIRGATKPRLNRDVLERFREDPDAISVALTVGCLAALVAWVFAMISVMS